MLIRSLYAGTPFTMGKGKNWKIIYPELGPSLLTLNHAIHQPGNEFTQHRHEDSVDIIIVLEGECALRQGKYYTPLHAFDAVFIPAGEVHGTVNTSKAPIRLMSFQVPPDQLLYAGKRDRPAADDSVKHEDFPVGDLSGVDIRSLLKGSLLFRTDRTIIRRIFGKHQSTGYTELVYVRLVEGESLSLQSPVRSDESVLVMLGGAVVCRSTREVSRYNCEGTEEGTRILKKDGVLWFAKGEQPVLESIAGTDPTHDLNQSGSSDQSESAEVADDYTEFVICSHQQFDPL